MDNTESKILSLNLKKRYFDQIKRGVKTSEYRLYKIYWIKRLMNKDGSFKHFDFVHFSNGYHSKAPKMLVECNSIKITRRKNMSFWFRKYFEIRLGKVIEKN